MNSMHLSIVVVVVSLQQQQVFCLENISTTIGLLQQNEKSTQILKICQKYYLVFHLQFHVSNACIKLQIQNFNLVELGPKFLF